jgi:hypothetical protein
MAFPGIEIEVEIPAQISQNMVEDSGAGHPPAPLTGHVLLSTHYLQRQHRPQILCIPSNGRQ